MVFGDDVMTQSQMGVGPINSRMSMSQSHSSSGLKSRLFNALGFQSTNNNEQLSGVGETVVLQSNRQQQQPPAT